MRIVKAIFLILMISNFLTAQNCYIQLSDASGFDRSPYQQDLEEVACDLVQSFPMEFRDQFKVFDFGFYSLTESFEGGYQEVWEKVVQDAQTQSPYYLLFGKQSDSRGIYTKFWVDLKLPESGNFSCFEKDIRDRVEFQTLKSVSDQYDLSGRSPFLYYEAEIKGIEQLAKWIAEAIICCQPGQGIVATECSICSWTFSDLTDYLEEYEFVRYECTAQGILGQIDSSCICNTTYQISSSNHQAGSVELDKFTSISQIIIDEREVDFDILFEFLKSYGSLVEQEGNTFYGAVTDQSVFCNSIPAAVMGFNASSSSTNLDYTTVNSKFNSAQVSVWFNLIYLNDKAYLGVRTKNLINEGMKWAGLFSTKNGSAIEIAEYVHTVNYVKLYQSGVRYDRAEELYDLFNQGNGFMSECGDISDWADLASFVIPQSCQDRLDQLNWENQDILAGNSKTVNLDRHSVKITKLPDLNGDGVATTQELFDTIRLNWPKFADGGMNVVLNNWKDYNINWNWKYFQNDFNKWESDNPITTIINIDVDPYGFFDSWGITDDASVICSSFDNDCCWVFSTITTGHFTEPYDGTHPVSGNRQFGISTVSGGYEFYVKAADRGKLYKLLMPFAQLTGNDMTEIFYRITDRTWDNLSDNIALYINSKNGIALKNEPILKRPIWTEVINKLRSTAPITSISCE